MRFVIVTGMSGAGKSTALKMLEDMGYFCVDNLPVPLLPKFAEMIAMPDSKLNQAAVGIDIRGGQAFRGLEGYLKELDESGIHYEILFLDAGNDVLLKRYKETRRQHPLRGAGHIDRGIAKEREEIAFLKIRATFILDTSKDFKNLYITVMSFGFKYGIPQDADLVFDVRFLPNPYYIEELRAKTGNEAEVRDYVMKSDKAQEFFRQLSQMMDFLIPNYILEGKNQLVVAVGCTGGKHRSVTLANALYQYLEVRENYGVRIEHRDIEKDAIRKGK